LDLTFAQSRPKSRTKVAKICRRSRKVAEGRRTKKNDVMRIKVLRSLACNVFDKVAQRRKPKSRKVAEGRTKSRNVARNLGDLQVQDRPTITSIRDVPVFHTGLISCSTGTSIPPKVENPGSTSVDGSKSLSGTALRVLMRLLESTRSTN
jgi:hypothetical protein